METIIYFEHIIKKIAKHLDGQDNFRFFLINSHLSKYLEKEYYIGRIFNDLNCQILTIHAYMECEDFMEKQLDYIGKYGINPKDMLIYCYKREEDMLFYKMLINTELYKIQIGDILNSYIKIITRDHMETECSYYLSEKMYDTYKEFFNIAIYVKSDRKIDSEEFNNYFQNLSKDLSTDISNFIFTEGTRDPKLKMEILRLDQLINDRG